MNMYSATYEYVHVRIKKITPNKRPEKMLGGLPGGLRDSYTRRYYGQAEW